MEWNISTIIALITVIVLLLGIIIRVSMEFSLVKSEYNLLKQKQDSDFKLLSNMIEQNANSFEHIVKDNEELKSSVNELKIGHSVIIEKMNNILELVKK